jgi:predicted DNA-binding transcriptional regulator AlpA
MYDVTAAMRRLVREEVARALDDRHIELQRTDRASQVVSPLHLTPAEAAQLTGLSPYTLSNWRTLGKGPTWYKVGRLVRYDTAELEAWMHSAAG